MITVLDPLFRGNPVVRWLDMTAERIPRGGAPRRYWTCRWALLLSPVFLVACCPGVAPVEEPTSRTPVPEEPLGDANLLRNPGFEEGREPWVRLFDDGPFAVSPRAAHGGRSGALLTLRAEAHETGRRIYMVSQDVEAETFPETISGWYRVESWRGEKPVGHTGYAVYVQFVVVVFGAANLEGFSNHQIRYILAGLDHRPFRIQNARFVCNGRDEPATGRWIPFERDLHADFRAAWGSVPEGFERIRVLFEVRYDGKEAGSEASADVFFDDLYLGPRPAPPWSSS